jgi:hypothetical protein
MSQTSALLNQAKDVLQRNNKGMYTMPAEQLYPHQWLWDSCFISIGVSHYDIERAKTEILSLLRGQWHNGMLPNIIFSDSAQYRTDRNLWRSWVNPFSPEDVSTSGITQPPMLAEAIVQIGAKMNWPERRKWYRSVWPALVAYHEWLYDERDPHNEGLVLQIHPWETGLDNTPPWMFQMHEHLMPLWIRMIKTARLEPAINVFRRDTKSVPINERFSTIEALCLFDIQRRLRRKAYNIDQILDHSLFAIEDLTFNSILIRANTLMIQIGKSAQLDIPSDLLRRMKQSPKTLEELWDPLTNQYYSRDFITHKLLKIPSVAALMPLYAGSVSKARAVELVKMLENEHMFGPAYPIPSVPIDSPWFSSKLYWQGPSWVNINWLVIDGLKRYGFMEHAQALRDSTLEMVKKSGFYEYFDPLSGEGAGTTNFSWTAALTIDLLQSES